MTEQPRNGAFKEYEKLHYDKHIEFFKWMMIIAGCAIAIFVAVALRFTYSTMKDYKEEYQVPQD